MILMNDFKKEPIELRQAMLDGVGRVLDSGWYILGNEVKSFEKQWALVCGTTHAIGVGNGMDAIEIALRTLGVGKGDEVITTSMTAFATVLAILRAGATPVLADIDMNTALLSVESARRCITKKTKAVLLVHLYGQVRKMDEWLSFCQKYGVILVEDCAQAHLSTWGGRVAGSFGDAGAYSFYPTKNLGAPGDAGMIVSSSDAVAAMAERFRNYGQSTRYHHPQLGMNSRLDEIHASILSERLKWLPKFTDRRRIIAEKYMSEIKNPLIRLLDPPEESLAHVYHLFVVTCENRDQLQNYMMQHGIQTLIHYPIPIHAQPPCINMLRDPMGLINSDRLASTCISLPCHPQMTEEDVLQVVSAINSFKDK